MQTATKKYKEYILMVPDGIDTEPMERYIKSMGAIVYSFNPLSDDDFILSQEAQEKFKRHPETANAVKMAIATGMWQAENGMTHSQEEVDAEIMSIIRQSI